MAPTPTSMPPSPPPTLPRRRRRLLRHHLSRRRRRRHRLDAMRRLLAAYAAIPANIKPRAEPPPSRRRHRRRRCHHTPRRHLRRRRRLRRRRLRRFPYSGTLTGCRQAMSDDGRRCPVGYWAALWLARCACALLWRAALQLRRAADVAPAPRVCRPSCGCYGSVLEPAMDSFACSVLVRYWSASQCIVCMMIHFCG